MDIKFEKRIVVVGHYGSGKTEFALNLAFKLKEEGNQVTIVDLDVVNPYFRTNDIAEELRSAGIKVIAPLYANTNVDVPALSPEVYAAFEMEGSVIFDVGGNDDGAIVLGRFNQYFKQKPYELLGVVNVRRPLTCEVEEIVEGLRDIEAVSRLKFTGLINCTNLSYETTPEVVQQSLSAVEKAAELMNTTVKLVCVKEDIAGEVKCDNLFPIKIKLKKW